MLEFSDDTKMLHCIDILRLTSTVTPRLRIPAMNEVQTWFTYTQVYHVSTWRYLAFLEQPDAPSIYPRLSALVMWGSAAKTPTVKASHDRI